MQLSSNMQCVHKKMLVYVIDIHQYFILVHSVRIVHWDFISDLAILSLTREPQIIVNAVNK